MKRTEYILKGNSFVSQYGLNFCTWIKSFRKTKMEYIIKERTWIREFGVCVFFFYYVIRSERCICFRNLHTADNNEIWKTYDQNTNKHQFNGRRGGTGFFMTPRNGRKADLVELAIEMCVYVLHMCTSFERKNACDLHVVRSTVSICRFNICRQR